MELASEMAETIMQKVDLSMSLIEDLSAGKSLVIHVANLKDPMRSLLARLKEFQMWMTMTEEKQDVKNWLKSVRSTLYEIEDLAEQISAHAAATHAGNTISLFQLKLNLRQSCKKMTKLTKELKKHVDETPKALSPDNLVCRKKHECTTSELPADPVGKFPDIMPKLHERGFSVVVISGMAGLGKTILAQRVFKFCGDHRGFNTRVWMWVGCQLQRQLEESSIISRVGEEMAKTEAKSRETVSSYFSFARPENKLLLVLDDVRTLNKETLEAIQKSLNSISVPFAFSTIKIVITTREDKVATADYGKIEIKRHSLGSMSDDDAKKLFKKVTSTNDVDDDDDELWNIGREILKRTRNVPRTIKDMAALLNKQDKRKWKAVMNAKLWCLRKGYSPVTDPSIIAVRILPSPLKRCFVFAALLQHHNSISVQHLIHLWISQGYITEKVSNDENQSLEDIAEAYYTALQDWSFFKDHETDFQLAKLVADPEILCAQISVAQNGSELKIEPIPDNCQGIRHLFLSSTVNQSSETSRLSLDELIEALPEQLRSFLKARGSTLTLTTQICINLFSKMTNLRSLDLNSSGITTVHNSIDSLKCLRYLNLSFNKFKYLPETITKLAKLQLLNVAYCESLAKLPNHFCRLRKLRYLYINGCKSLQRMPAGLGKMTSLQTLNVFVLGKHQKSCNLTEVSSLNLKSEPVYVFATQPETPLRDGKRCF